MLKSFINRLIPRYTNRRLAAGLILTLVTQPSRFFCRLNKQNLFLYKQFDEVRAHCCICGYTGSLYYGMPDRRLRKEHGIGLLRETLLCKSCGSTNRQRTLAYGLMESIQKQLRHEASNLKELLHYNINLKIWDTDAFSPLSKIFLPSGHCVLSKYIPEKPFGTQLAPGVFNIDLQAISFESDRFDVILSSDIMEHVRDDHSAHLEIFRCLKPGGMYVFTVPFNEDRARSEILVDATSAADIFLTLPHYHGDPLTGGILAYRIYGRELIADLESIGFKVDFHLFAKSHEGIFSGDCFIATKPPG